jgi:GrpB-like predicted nucleotidyltransferase (UPF0157 family)/GNAT superfamily N-acetyltransferase
MINVVPYEEAWSLRFQQEKTILDRVFQYIPHVLHHIGSTAIIGSQAKPIIDILGVTSDITLIDTLSAQLEELGYEALGEYGMKQRRFFRKKNAIHLHIFEDSDPEVCRHLRFVGYVNAHSDAIRQYSELKKRLAEKHPDDIISYLLGKESWVKQIDFVAAKERTIPTVYPTLGSRKSKWTLEEIIKALHVNMHLQMTYFSKYHPSIKLVYQPDVSVVVADIADDMFNYVLSSRFTEENASQRILEILQLYRERNLPFSWWLSESEDQPKNLAALLEASGLKREERVSGMYLELYDYKPPLKKENIRRVESAELLRDFTDVIASVCNNPEIYEKIYRDVPPILYQNGAPLEMYLLYRDDVPVTTGIALFHANVMGIYYIATRPEYRRRGLGTEMMHYLLARAKSKGYHIATLEASSQGKNIYERLGFTECCRFQEYKLT